MEKRILSEMVESNFSTTQISNTIGLSKTTVRYWLKKYNLKTNHLSFGDAGPKDYGDEKFCPRCKSNNPLSEFYQRRGKDAGSVYCKICTNEQTMERQRQLKSLAIEYKGGSCTICGYNKCNSALEFHHLNPKEKDFTLGHMKQKKFDDKIKKELDKCILLCANCHREIHSKVISYPQVPPSHRLG
jgi:5-methylcytosine-specific restriction endonuclease McrA